MVTSGLHGQWSSDDLNAVWGSSGSDVFAVGNSGIILHYDGIECLSHGDCDDGLYCNGIETCDIGNQTCLPGIPVSCPDGQICDEDSNQCVIARMFRNNNPHQ